MYTRLVLRRMTSTSYSYPSAEITGYELPRLVVYGVRDQTQCFVLSCYERSYIFFLFFEKEYLYFSQADLEFSM